MNQEKLSARNALMALIPIEAKHHVLLFKMAPLAIIHWHINSIAIMERIQTVPQSQTPQLLIATSVLQVESAICMTPNTKLMETSAAKGGGATSKTKTQQ